jgi:hypothetical protein
MARHSVGCSPVLFVKHRFITPLVAGQLELATERRSLRPAAGCPMPELTAAVFGEARSIAFN